MARSTLSRTIASSEMARMAVRAVHRSYLHSCRLNSATSKTSRSALSGVERDACLIRSLSEVILHRNSTILSQLDASMRRTTMIPDLARNWHKSGINYGDTILVHSSLKRTLRAFNTSPEDVMKSFLEAVGPE